MDPRRLLPALTALACACVAVTLVVALARLGNRPTAGPVRDVRPVTAVGDAAAPGPARILADWDERRAAAWARGDAEALRDLYVAGSRTGEVDVASLRRYLRRGLTVEGLRTQVLALHVVERAPGRRVLSVTDRVVGGRVVGGTSSVSLPADRASTRRIVLVRPEGGSGEEWLVAEASDQASAAASTSRTSSSSKS